MTNLALLFHETVSRLPDKQALLFKLNNRYRPVLWKEFGARVRAVAASLRARGIGAGDRVAILCENRPEWAILDLAALSIGAVTVPIYTSLSPDEIKYILSDSASRLVAVSSTELLEKVIRIHRDCRALESVLATDASLGVSKDELTIPLHFFRDFEKAKSSQHQWLAEASRVPKESPASIIYTSGTTGFPKGVILTHANFIENVQATTRAISMSQRDVHLSFLPLCHVFERMAGHYLMIRIGATIAYAESMDTVPQNLIEIRPTFVLGVPRFYEKIKARVTEAVQSAGGVKKGLFYWAKEQGRARMSGQRNFLFNLKFGLADVLVYKKFRRRLGGRVRFCISGGAALPKEIAEFFASLGVMIYEGYGLTETSPVISVNRPGRFKFGSVGIPFDNVQVRICDDKEIAVTGPSVMQGYFNKPDETAQALKDGWFYTGDLGEIDKDGFLSITGRKKEIIVTSGGKKVSPRPIEEMFETDPYILRCVLFGEGRKCITALIVPNEAKIIEYAKSQKIAFESYSELLKDSKIHALIETRIEALSGGLASYEKIKFFSLIDHDLTQAAGELTPTLKVKREVVYRRYKDDLVRFYEQNA